MSGERAMWFLLGGDMLGLSIICALIGIVLTIVTWPFRALKRRRDERNKR